jgi:hypothetical protein
MCLFFHQSPYPTGYWTFSAVKNAALRRLNFDRVVRLGADRGRTFFQTLLTLILTIMIYKELQVIAMCSICDCSVYA